MVRTTVLTLCLILAYLASFPPHLTSASVAHCSPNAISSATVYTNYQAAADTFIAFSYDINTACYPPAAAESVSIALVETTALYGANTLNNKDALPANILINDGNVIHGNNWMSAAFVADGVEAANWSAFYFDLRLARVGSPGILEIYLTATKGGGGADQYEPTDGPILLEYGSYNANRLALVPTVYRVYFNSGPTLAAGTGNYALILSAPDGNGANYVIWRVETGTANIGAESVDAGLNWNFIAGGVTPHVAWYGQTLDGTFTTSDIMVEYLQDTFVSGKRTGGLYWPTDITPTAGHDLTIPDYKLAILNRTASPTEPDAVYRLDDACQVVRTAVLPTGFKLSSLADFGAQPDNAAEGIPFLEMLMGDEISLAENLGLDATAAFLILGIFFSLITMAVVAKIFPNYILVLLAGLLPIIILTMSNFLPELILLTTGLFVTLYITWRTMVKGDV